MFRRVCFGIGVMLALAGVSCDKAQLLAPTNSTVTLSAQNRVLPTGGSTEVSAAVIEQSGTPVQNGTVVRFTTSLGRVEPIEAQTRNGIAVTTFFAGNDSGVAEVRGTSGGAGGTTPPATTPPTTSSGTNIVMITVGGAAAETVLVSASPTTVPSSGGTTTIIATAVDVNGNRLRNVPVSFSTTAGTLSATAAATDDGGEARVQLTTNRAATVTARAGAKSATVAISVATPASVALAVTPASPVAGQPVTLTVTPTIAAGSAAPRVVVTWGDGSSDDLGSVPAARGVTHTYSAAGSYTIAAAATSDGETISTSIAVAVGAPSVSVTVSPSSGTIATTFVFRITPEAGTTAQSITIDFGDGTTQTITNISATTTVSHVYGALGGAGDKTVRVTQTNANGSTSSAIVVVVVT